jgi:hypothetical protein
MGNDLSFAFAPLSRSSGVQELRSSDITTDYLGVKPLHLKTKEIKGWGYNDRRPP